MSFVTLNNGKILGDGQNPYIVAEMNSSHGGNMETAKEMILAAKRAGCDGVKFQSWSAESLYSQSYYKENRMAKKLVKKFSLSETDLLELSGFCMENEIDFSSTPYSESEVDFLADRCGAPYIKIASMDIDNFPFLEYIAKKGVPVVLSTGMASYDEVKKAVHTIEDAGNEQICILHCVSVYPAAPQLIHLRNMTYLKKLFPDYPVGYSDHTMGTEIACASAALGACMIEKHFTLDRSSIGMDNQMAAQPQEMADLVNQCRNVYRAMGDEQRHLSEDENKQAALMRRSVVARCGMKSGEEIELSKITAKRPGTGVPAGEYEKLIGRKLNRDIKADEMILWQDIV